MWQRNHKIDTRKQYTSHNTARTKRTPYLNLNYLNCALESTVEPLYKGHDGKVCLSTKDMMGEGLYSGASLKKTCGSCFFPLSFVPYAVETLSLSLYKGHVWGGSSVGGHFGFIPIITILILGLCLTIQVICVSKISH